MHADDTSVGDFISDKKTFVIPVYQRNYDWKTKNCERLFDDVKFIAKNGDEHFIGTFVYQQKSVAGTFQEYVIIDGQQRIASVILLAKAIYDSTDDADLKEEIHPKFIKHDRGKLKGECKLRPNEYDRATFEKLMADEFDENNFTADEKKSALYKNYKLFLEKISEPTSPSLQELHDAIYNLKVVSISLDNEKPQEIFESLNSTGLDLTGADLIRNFLLMPLAYDVQETFYKNYWLKIEELLRLSDDVKNFMVQYLISKRHSNAVMKNERKQLSPNNLYEAFKDYFKENSLAPETCLKDMLHNAELFRRFIFSDDTNVENLSPLDKKFYELTHVLKAGNAPIILMYLLDRFEKNHFDEETFIKFVDALISLTFRAKVCKQNGITQQFAGNVLTRLDKANTLDEKIFWRAITFGSGGYSFPSDATFQKELAGNELCERIKTDGCKYFLYGLERRANPSMPNYSALTVERILPARLNEWWRNYLRSKGDLQAHEFWLQSLGNWLLIEKSDQQRGADFNTKKIFAARSKIFSTRAVSNYSDWTSKQIQVRAKKLAAEALAVWTLPEEFNSFSTNAEEIFNLNSDFGELTGEKPATLSIDDTEMEMPYWNQMLYEIIRQLYTLDKDTFRRANQSVIDKKSLFSTDLTRFRLDDDLYMKTGFDTKNCLRYSKILVENFDNLADTNFMEDIWFTLRR